MDRKKSGWSTNPNLLFSFDPSYVLDAQSIRYLPKETSSRETTEIAEPLCVFGRWKTGPSRCRQQQQQQRRRLSSRQPGPIAGAQVSGQQQNRTIQKVQFKPRLKAMWKMRFNPTSYYVADFLLLSFFLSFTAGFRDEVTVGPSRAVAPCYGPTRRCLCIALDRWAVAPATIDMCRLCRGENTWRDTDIRLTLDSLRSSNPHLVSRNILVMKDRLRSRRK